MDELQILMDDISEWSNAIFGVGHRNPFIIYHLKKEVNELIEALDKSNDLGRDNSVGVGEYLRQISKTKMEYADCFMLLLDSAHHFGLTAENIIDLTREKLEVNKTRKCGKPDENGVVEHILEAPNEPRMGISHSIFISTLIEQGFTMEDWITDSVRLVQYFNNTYLVAMGEDLRVDTMSRIALRSTIREWIINGGPGRLEQAIENFRIYPINLTEPRGQMNSGEGLG